MIQIALMVLALALGGTAWADDLPAPPLQNDSEASPLGEAPVSQVLPEEQSSPPAETAEEKKARLPVRGILLEKGTRKALADLTIYIRDEKSKAVVETLTTDAGGHFQCRLVPGQYTAIVAAVGYDKFEEGFNVASEDEPELALRLVPVTINPYEIIVRRKEKTSEVSDRQLTMEEAVQTPGTNRDALSSIKSLPGINSVSVFNGYGSGIIIRGSSQEDSLFLLNGHEMIGDYYHFGGLESVIEPELIESIEYIAGGFSAEYGDAMGGVVSGKIKDPRTDRWGGFANLSLLSTSLMLEGPVSEKDSVAFSLKRGFLGEYMRIYENIDEEAMEDIQFKQYPDYYDGTFIYRHAFAKGNDFKLTTVGKWEAVGVEMDYEPANERTSNYADLDNRYFTAIGEWEYARDDYTSILSAAVTRGYAAADRGSRAYLKQTYNFYELNEKLAYQASDTHLLKGGVGLRLVDANIDSYFFSFPKEGEIDSSIFDQELRLDKDFFLYYPSLYLMDQIELGRLTVTPGVHTMYDSHNEHGAVDPRLSLKYQLSKETTLKGATGLYSQRPTYDETVEPFGTKGLKPEKSIHGVLGVEQRLSRNISLDVQTYYKDFYDLVAREPDTLDPSRFTNDGTGYSYGAEILLRHQMTDHFFGWLSYTYSVTRRKDAPGAEERYFDWDMPHNLIVVASYKPNRYWSFGLKYQYRSGSTYTDLLDVETLYDVDKDEYYPLYDGPINEERLPAYQSLDFRLDKYCIFNNFILSTYIDWRNVLQQKNVLGTIYSRDYTQSEDFLDISSQVPMIFFGVKLDF